MPPRSLNSDSSPIIDSHRKLHPRSSPPTAFADPLGVPDAEYAFFLQHLRVDGHSYVAEIPVGDGGPPLRIKYEEVRGSGADEAKKGCERESSPAESLSESLSRCEDQNCSIDKDYQIFLNSIKTYGGTMVLEWRNNVTVYEQEPNEDEDVEVQEEEEESTEEDEVKAIVTKDSEEEDAICPIQMEETSFDKPLVSQESEDQSYFREILQHKPSSFRTELLSLLSKPFDQKEYENQKSEINVRKPVIKYKHLRDESIPYSSNKLGSSYLDHYPDLARRIESAMGDRKKQLLLRGFFFWLENVCWPGSFRPWVAPISNHIIIDPFEDEMVLPLQIDLSGRKEIQTVTFSTETCLLKPSLNPKRERPRRRRSPISLAAIIYHSGRKRSRARGIMSMEAELIPGLPDCLALECLLRLPFHAILNARTVCKRWKHKLVSQESEYQSYFMEILQHKPSLFRAELLSLLSKPFDQKEYENQKSLFNVRKPVIKYKHLRDDSVSYSTKKLGSSYLDHFPDLARRIESTMDDRKKELLLRGFFFWLKNISCQDAFRPWIPPIPLQIDFSGRKEVQTVEERMRNKVDIEEEEGKLIASEAEIYGKR
ncbi:uncharacterized protein LOC141837374 [Curcuma longa]|uniref:uncharacterized protein LOC141837374 n=1 Tax=Curcuma longa TaxID=136217 RepID=UPI003D9EC48D